YQGLADGRRVTLADGTELATSEELTGPAFVAFPPAAVTLHRERPHGSARNVWKLEIAGLDLHGDQVRADLAGALPMAADLTPAAAAELDLATGTSVWASVKAVQTHAYPA
ncbi:TOBE domain-containing protein, partial [Kitasatospora sp. NPDC058263]